MSDIEKKECSVCGKELEPHEVKAGLLDYGGKVLLDIQQKLIINKTEKKEADAMRLHMIHAECLHNRLHEIADQVLEDIAREKGEG